MSGALARPRGSLRQDLAAFAALRRELGLWAALAVGVALRRGVARGEPWQGLPPPDCAEEALSRAQIGPALVLYRLLRQRPGGPARALEVTERVVVAATLVSLRQTLGPLGPAQLEPLGPAERERFVLERGRRFFNATLEWRAIEPERVEFVVTACRFPRLCAEAGVPELAPVFCQGDAAYFGTVEPSVTLERPHTIAGGAASCPFTLRYRP